MLTPNDLLSTRDSTWAPRDDYALNKYPGQWSLSPQFYTGLLNDNYMGDNTWAPLRGIQEIPNSPPISDLLEYERTKEALHFTTEFEALDLNKQFSVPPHGYICKLW